MWSFVQLWVEERSQTFKRQFGAKKGERLTLWAECSNKGNQFGFSIRVNCAHVKSAFCSKREFLKQSHLCAKAVWWVLTEGTYGLLDKVQFLSFVPERMIKETDGACVTGNRYTEEGYACKRKGASRCWVMEPKSNLTNNQKSFFVSQSKSEQMQMPFPKKGIVDAGGGIRNWDACKGRGRRRGRGCRDLWRSQCPHTVSPTHACATTTPPPRPPVLRQREPTQPLIRRRCSNSVWDVKKLYTT